tara:strand:- start:1229 stop:1438 length:210 start_codon:yes stop_codon:yes gene_type:complete
LESIFVGQTFLYKFKNWPREGSAFTHYDPYVNTKKLAVDAAANPDEAVTIPSGPTAAASTRTTSDVAQA